MSDLLNSASLVMIPSGYKEDTVYSVVPSDGSGDLSFTRASNGTRVNSAGLVEVCPWNLLEQSEDFSTWTTYNTGTGVAPVITVNDGTAPNGTTTADKIVFNTGAGTSSGDISTIYQTVANQPIGVFTASIYAKVASGTAKLVLRHAGGGQYTTLNLTSDWQRFEIAETNPTVGGVTFELGLRRGLANEPISSPVTCYLWGAQLNIGSTAKPYFPTTDRLNVPRLTYQNGGGGCPSLLLEKQSTNLVTYSEDLTNADWIKQQATISANATTSPDGTQNADKLIINNGVSGGYVYQLKSTSSGTVYTGSFYVKAGGVNYTRFYTNISGSYNEAVINLSTGAITNSDFAITPTTQNIGNGWYRVNYTTTSGGGQVVVYVDGGSTSTGGSFTGNGTDGIYLWGAQLEASSYPTSYIPTTSSSATRVADVALKTSATALIGQTEGTLFADFLTSGLPSIDQYFMNISDGSTSNIVYIGFYSNILVARVIDAGGLVVNINVVLATNTRYKVAFAYKANDCILYINGSNSGSDTSASIPACSKLSYNDFSNEGGYQLNESALFKTRLTNAELASLTTI